MSLKTTPLQPRFGAEVHGVDLSQPLSAGVSAELDDLLAREGVLVFRRQLLSEPDLVRFAGGFGELEKTIYTKGVSPYHPEVIYISNLKYPDGGNVGLLGDQELGWHSDQTYRSRPATGSMLYGLEVPSSSGCTYWANQYLAYESLPAQAQQAIEGRIGIFSYGKRLEVFYPKEQKNDKDLKQRTPENAPHPLVLSNPVTGRKALYADPVTLLEIEGLPKAESERILAVLAEHCSAPETVYAHRWSQGDVVFWDNGCTLHRRDPIESERARFMKRMTIYLRGERHCLPY
ncbi:MAG: TauD/TfdA family dioxygenase [Betaproteobacteria bacterium]|nr:TauD/TfdA family dioxygenase [Betaproteobacteria bacterium]